MAVVRYSVFGKRSAQPSVPDWGGRTRCKSSWSRDAEEVIRHEMGYLKEHSGGMNEKLSFTSGIVPVSRRLGCFHLDPIRLWLLHLCSGDQAADVWLRRCTPHTPSPPPTRMMHNESGHSLPSPAFQPPASSESLKGDALDAPDIKGG